MYKKSLDLLVRLRRAMQKIKRKNYPGLCSVVVIVKNIQGKMEHILHLLA
jgi:hypothetical protein